MGLADIEWTARGAARTIEDWRELFPIRHLDRPSYATDIVGALERFDERDCLFARRDLVPGTDRYAAYYAAHPDRRPIDDDLRSLPYLGAGEPVENASMMRALFDSVLPLGALAVVAGDTSAETTLRQPVEMSPDVAAMKVKAFAGALGADVVGIGPLDKAFVYTNVGRTFHGQEWGEPSDLDHPYAISLGIKMNTAGLSRAAPNFPDVIESGLAYARGALISVQLAMYIRGLGYRARAHHLRNYQVLSVPVAVDGGLGELSRCGFLITRDFGNCLRLATVTTDLLLALDRPVDIGVQAFCERCVVCAKACPVGAIPQGGKVLVRGVRKWALDAERCFKYWHTVGSDCGICIAVCPWSRWTLGPRPSSLEPPVAGGFYRPAPRPDWLALDQ